MPINKDLSVSPYFDDFSEDKNFYKVLFKPSVAVQVRELNQLQTILQAQIEKFGNNIYKRGTIIDGVNFIYYPEYAYVKILDSQLDGIPAVPANYVTNFAVDPTTNLTAHIINSADGFESTNPDLKTLYLRYINSGDSGTETAFASSSVLTIYDYLDSINKISIVAGSSGFANNDAIIFCPALEVTLSTNTDFTVGETITQSGNTHFAIVTATTTVKGKKVLKIRPRTTDLTNTSISTSIWQFTDGEDIIGSTSGATATIVSSIGSGAAATLSTSADVGKIISVDVTARGSGYYVAPYCSIKSSGVASAVGSRDYASLNLSAHNFIAQVTVSAEANSVGVGYAFGVTEGVIYQKGYFTRVSPQTILVRKYDNFPDQLAIGFDTVETVVDSNIDQDLLDNATGQSNEFAPGADRLNLEPTLVVLTTEEASANDEFLSIVEFSEGQAYRENKRTQFNTIMDEMANRTSEAAGDFVLDQFLVTTRSSANQSHEGRSFAVVTDPGKGYINGYRVETRANYAVDVDKGIDSRSATNLSATIDYGNYILITQIAGNFNCNVGNQISLMDSARNYASNTTLVAAGTISSYGNVIGTARVRNIVYDSGETGTSSTIYRLYLFDITMSAGYSFGQVRGVYAGALTNKGIADAVLTFDATTNTSITKLFDTTNGSSLLIDTGTDSTKNITDLTYVYRTTNESVNIANNGTTSILLSAPEEYFAYESASLTSNEKKTIVLVPTGANIILQPNTSLDGTANTVDTSNTFTITSASVNKFEIGDFIALFSDSTTYVIRRVTNKTATTLQVDSAVSFTNGTAAFSRALPKQIPVSLDSVPGATVTTSGGSKTLAINLGLTVKSAADITVSITYDVQVRDASAQAKTADRDNYVKIDLTSSTLAGPWCLGIPDVFRLKAVYLSNSSTVNVNSTDVTDQFFIDHNQNPDYYDLSYLYKRNDADIILDASTWLLVKFDAFTSSAGVYTINSYVSANTDARFADDSLTLANLGTKTNSFEIPELYTSTGKYYDLINCIDFRPSAANTAAYAKSVAAATVNPASTVTFSGSSKKFPLPESGVTFDRDYFLGRKDVVVISNNNRIKVVRGVPSDTQPFPEPKIPKNTLVLNKLIIPSYPCVPEKFSAATYAILDRKMSNERLLLKRIRDKTVKTEQTDFDISIGQPKAFTMADINTLERRIKDLEYTVALSLVETDLKDKIIPSAVSPSINRFKFGFFVDDYTTKKNSDLDNVEYQADVIDSRVVPISESTLTTHGRGYRLGDYTSEIALINQDLASQVPPPVVAAPPPPEQPPVVVAPPSTSPSPPSPPPVVSPPPAPVPPAPPVPIQVITAKNVSVFRSYRNSQFSYADNLQVQMSSVPGTYTIQYNFYGDKDKLRITKLADGGNILVYEQRIKHTGTLTFNHDPSNGRDYYFTVERESDKWEYTLTYPIDDISFVDPTPPTVNVSTTFYTGTLVSIEPGYFSPAVLGQNFGSLAYVSQGEVQDIKIASLKPLTSHTVRIADSTSTVTIDPVLTTGTGAVVTGATMTTDAYGTLSFKMLIDNQIMASLNDLSAQTTAQYNGIPSSLLVLVSSPDSTSGTAFYLAAKPAPVVIGTPGIDLNNVQNSVPYGDPVAVVGHNFNQLREFSSLLL